MLIIGIGFLRRNNMKKKLFVLFLAFAMVFAFAACGGGGGSDSGSDEGTGSVYWLNYKAAAYTEETGVPCKVVTAASGSYSDTQTAEMAKSEPPTLFNVGNMSALKDWEDYCLTLDGTDFMNELTTTDFNLKNEAGETKAIGWIYESYGIITNKALLEKAGHSLDEIKDFDSLKAVADDIHARAGELGFDAFTSAGLDDSSSWRFSGHLANMPLFYEFRDDGIVDKPAEIKGTYMDNFKKIWDLYITDSAQDPTSLTTATGDQAEAEFGEGKAVFYQNGTWEWAALTADKFQLNPDDITMIPIYCGVDGEENAGLCSGTENCLAVNRDHRDIIRIHLELVCCEVSPLPCTILIEYRFAFAEFSFSLIACSCCQRCRILSGVSDVQIPDLLEVVHVSSLDSSRLFCDSVITELIEERHVGQVAGESPG